MGLADLYGGATQLVIAPVTGLGLATGLLGIGTADGKAEALVFELALQFCGDRTGSLMPAVITMPAMKRPVVESAQA
jgi:hypothetical protein